MATRNLSFRLLTRQDFPLLATWLSRPHVRQWWHHDPSPAAVEADFGPAVDGCDPTELMVVLEADRPIGLIQSYRIGDDPKWLAALGVVDPHEDSIGIDYLIGEPDAVGRSLGPQIIRLLVERVWRQHPQAPAVVVAVDQDNTRSWRALERVGFQRIWSGVLQSDDPSDQGPSHLYHLTRPQPMAGDRS